MSSCLSSACLSAVSVQMGDVVPSQPTAPLDIQAARSRHRLASGTKSGTASGASKPRAETGSTRVPPGAGSTPVGSHSVSGGHSIQMDMTPIPSAVNSKNFGFSNPALLRGSFAADSALRRAGDILGERPCTAEHYDLSRPVDHLDVFISHNWSTPRRAKFLVLALHFNGNIAFLLAVFVSFAMFWLEVAGILPSFHLYDSGESIRMSYWCQVMGCITFVMTLLFWHDVSRIFGIRGQTVFLDKTCVHQTDVHLKTQGIEHLANFIYYSWSVVIVYSDVYLQKLWTVYEIASFLLLHPEGALHIRPLFLPKAVLGGMFFFLVFNLSWGVLHSHWVQDHLPLSGVVADLAFSIVVAAPACFAFSVLVYNTASEFGKISERVHSFRISEAKCFSESDREVVQRNIVRFMRMRGHIDDDATEEEAFEEFEAMVRRDVPRRCKASLGHAGLPYSMAFAMALPYLLQQFDDWGAYVTNPSPSEGLAEFCVEFARKMTSVLAVFPAGVAMSLLFGQRLVKRPRIGPRVAILMIFFEHFLFCYGGASVLKILAAMANDGSSVGMVLFVFATGAYVTLVTWLYRPAPYRVHRRKSRAM